MPPPAKRHNRYIQEKKITQTVTPEMLSVGNSLRRGKNTGKISHNERSFTGSFRENSNPERIPSNSVEFALPNNKELTGNLNPRPCCAMVR